MHSILQQVRTRLGQPDAAGLTIPKDETAEYYAAMAFDLLADRTAYRQQVAAELRELLAIADAMYQHNGDFGPHYIEDAAAALQIDF